MKPSQSVLSPITRPRAIKPSAPAPGFVLPKRPACGLSKLPAGSVGFTVARVCAGFETGGVDLFTLTGLGKPRVTGKVEMQSNAGDVQVEVFNTPETALTYERQTAKEWKTDGVAESRVANVIALVAPTSDAGTEVATAMSWLGDHES